MLIVLGMQDGIFGWHGSGRGALSVLGGEETYRTWSRLNGCTEVSRREAPDGWPDASNFQWWRAAGCANSVQVVLIGADRAGHGWQLAERVDTGEIVAEFFNRVEGSRSREDKE